jgi:hypothetical protein
VHARLAQRAQEAHPRLAPWKGWRKTGSRQQHLCVFVFDKEERRFAAELAREPVGSLPAARRIRERRRQSDDGQIRDALQAGSTMTTAVQL